MVAGPKTVEKATVLMVGQTKNHCETIAIKGSPDQKPLWPITLSLYKQGFGSINMGLCWSVYLLCIMLFVIRAFLWTFCDYRLLSPKPLKNH